MTARVDPFGILLVDKPVGPTSHDVVHQIRRSSGARKVGHTGTLDPMASGLLVVCLGPATRLSEYLTKKDKRYLAKIQFGTETDSHDATGQVVSESGLAPTRDELEAALKQFRGSLDQVPPSYSAIKVDGRKAYKLARAGRAPDLDPREITIHELALIRYQPPELELAIHCSAGTYIRSLARDLGRSVAAGAHLSGLRRTAVGSFSVEQAHNLDELTQNMEAQNWLSMMLPAAEALPELPRVRLGNEQLEEIRHGRPVKRESADSGLALGLSADGELVAILEAAPEQLLWRPRKVFIA